LAKPFSIQAPEDIAKEYAGNKQKIAQAAQMGVVDPTAAVLAGMFIDRMRSAQVMEAGQQPTVAQQVFSSQPSAPPAGLGATPQAAAMPPQEMGAPEGEMPMMAAGGMVPPYASGGGLSDVPVPDGMFDEPSNGGFGDGYAGGGMVAFSGGGSTGGFGDYIEQMVRKLDPNIQITGRARTPARNAQVGGVAGSYHLIDAARDIRTPDGMSKSQFVAQLKSVFGPDYDVLPSKGNSVHIEPGPKLGAKVRAGARPNSVPNIIPERNLGTADGRGMSYEDSATLAGRLLKDPEEYAQAKEEARARFEEMRSPEEYEKQRKGDMWQTLAEIGFNMASSKAPSVLQAIGEAAAAAMPGARADRKARKALKDHALDGLLKLGAEDRAQAKEILSLGTDIYQTGLKQEQFDQELALRGSELDARKAEAAKKSPEEQLINTYYQQFLTAGDTPARAYQKAMYAAAYLMGRAKPDAKSTTKTKEQLLLDIAGKTAEGENSPAAPEGFVVD